MQIGQTNSRLRGPASRGLVSILFLVALAAPAEAAVFDTTLISRATGVAGAKGNADSDRPSISADGRFVAFQSLAQLAPADGDTNVDVYVRDLQTGTTTLASQTGGVKGNGGSARPSISADGRFVAFHSASTNLHGDDIDTVLDVYVRDLQANTTALVSRAGGAAGAKGNADSAFPAISADGRHVAFRSLATNLPDDADATLDVFIRDIQAGATTLVSRADGVAGASGNADSVRPVVSADGRLVAFESEATNLHGDDLDALTDIFVRDVQAGTTSLVSRAGGVGGAKGNALSERPGISADGRLVVFYSEAGNLHPDAPTSGGDVFVRDRQAATTTLVSRASGPTGARGNNGSAEPVISPDGRFVTFYSLATNLEPGDTDVGSDIFMRDLQDSATVLISRASGASGVNGNNQSGQAAAVSSDGRFVAFDSSATNLHPDDPDVTSDVFVREARAGAIATPQPPAGPPVGPKAKVSRLVFAKATVKPNGTVLIRARVSGAGTVKATARARVRASLLARLKGLTVAKRTVRPKRGGVVKIRLKARGRARTAILRSGGRLKTKTTLVFLPKEGVRRAKSKTVTFRLNR